MIQIYPIEGSHEVMAPYYNPAKLIRGERVYVKVIACAAQGEILHSVRQTLVGMIVPTIFTRAHIMPYDPAIAQHIPHGSRLAYAAEISEVLELEGKHSEAAHLRMEFKRRLNSAKPDAWSYTLWSLVPEEFEIQHRN